MVYSCHIILARDIVTAVVILLWYGGKRNLFLIFITMALTIIIARDFLMHFMVNCIKIIREQFIRLFPVTAPPEIYRPPNFESNFRAKVIRPSVNLFAQLRCHNLLLQPIMIIGGSVIFRVLVLGGGGGL